MNVNQPEENVVSGLYENYSETQKEILVIETRKTRNKLISVGMVIFIFDLVGLMMADVLATQTLLLTSVIPAIIIGLAFFAVKDRWQL
jgi:hypothetical protein